MHTVWKRIDDREPGGQKSVCGRVIGDMLLVTHDAAKAKGKARQEREGGKHGRGVAAADAPVHSRGFTCIACECVPSLPQTVAALDCLKGSSPRNSWWPASMIETTKRRLRIRKDGGGGGAMQA